MIALQVAAGIVLAVLVLRFWRQALWLAGIAVALVVIGLLLLWASARMRIDWESIGIIALVATAVPLLRAWAERSQHPVAQWIDREVNKRPKS